MKLALRFHGEVRMRKVKQLSSRALWLWSLHFQKPTLSCLLQPVMMGISFYNQGEELWTGKTVAPSKTRAIFSTRVDIYLVASAQGEVIAGRWHQRGPFLCAACSPAQPLGSGVRWGWGGNGPRFSLLSRRNTVYTGKQFLYYLLRLHEILDIKWLHRNIPGHLEDRGWLKVSHRKLRTCFLWNVFHSPSSSA